MEANLQDEYHGVKGLNALYRRLAAKHFTAIADLHNVLRSDYLRLRFNLGHFRVEHIDKHRMGKRRLVSKNNKVLEQQPTAIENYCEVFRKLGYPITPRSVGFAIRPQGGKAPNGQTLGQGAAESSPLWGDKRGRGSNSSPLWGDKRGASIGLAPFAAHRGKIYPRERMEQVVSQLCELHPDCRILLFGGGKREMEVFSQWCNRYPQCVNASAQCNGLKEELSLMGNLDVMISMDSANMHLASLVGIPVVSIWGATHPYAGFMGFGQKEDNAVQTDLPCRPCSIYGNKPCHRGDYACLYGIEPSTIINKVENIVGAERRFRPQINNVLTPKKERNKKK